MNDGEGFQDGGGRVGKEDPPLTMSRSTCDSTPFSPTTLTGQVCTWLPALGFLYLSGCSPSHFQPAALSGLCCSHPLEPNSLPSASCFSTQRRL
jgi:hypothetical protein